MVGVTGPDQQEEVGLLLNSRGREEEARHLMIPLCPLVTVNSSRKSPTLMIDKGVEFQNKRGIINYFI